MNLGLGQRLAAQGRHGDTMVAHISPEEAMILRLLGGSGTRNPRTGLPEFFAGGPGGVGRDSGGAVAGGKSTADKSGGLGGHDTSGGRTGPGGNQTRSGSNRAAGAFGGYGGGATSSGDGASITRTRRDGFGNVMNSTTADAAVAKKMGLTNDQYDKLSAGYRNAITDSYDDGMGGLLSLIGLNERVDFDKLKSIASGLEAGAPAPASLNNASWGFDTLGTLASAASLATGVPFDKAFMAAKYAAKQMGLNTFDPNPGMGFGLGEVDLGNDILGGGSPGANTGTSNTGVGVAQGPGTGQGGGGIGGMGGGRGDSGSLPRNHAAIAQGAQQANAGGGLLAALNPAATPTTPGLPAGLLQYLAQNPGLLQGLVANTRFGTGTVAPISYGQPLA